MQLGNDGKGETMLKRISLVFVMLLVVESASPENCDVRMIYPIQEESAKLVTTTGVLRIDFDFLDGEKTVTPMVSWLKSRTDMLAGPEASLNVFVEDIGDGQQEPNTKLANDLTSIKKSLHCGKILDADLVGTGRTSEFSYGVVSLACEKSDYSWYELIPIQESGTNFTYSAKIFSTPVAHLLASNLPFKRIKEIEHNTLTQSVFNIDPAGSIKMHVNLLSVSEFGDELSNMVTTFENLWQGLDEASIQADSKKFEELLSHFSPPSKKAVNDFVKSNGVKEWLNFVKGHDDVIGAIDLGEVLILLNRLYCEMEPSVRTQSFAELLVRNGDWMIVNHYFRQYFSDTLRSELIKEQICAKCLKVN